MQHAEAMLKLLLFGNLASGKSLLAERWLQRHMAFEFISIDACRMMFGDGEHPADDMDRRRSVVGLEQPGYPQDPDPCAK